MELKHIDIGNLAVSGLNMRGKGKIDIANILPSVRARGVLVPLIVRQNSTPDTYEIVAGKRRYHAALAVAEETGEREALPCAIIDAGDDAAALEASLLENVARLDPDEVTRWEGFTRLVREGRKPDQIAATFGITEVQVKRTLALGNLLPRIRGVYRRGEIDAVTVRHLTLASKAQQQAWLALLDDPDSYCPTGAQLKAWAFGGASIPVTAALFDVDGYAGAIVSDLFGDERYFADVGAFWTAQQAAIEGKAETYREAGWAVVVLAQGDAFHSWEHERCPKRKGGRVYIATGNRGDVAVHEGYVTLKEARRLSQGETLDKPKRAEITSGQQDYVDLHRHAAVRARLVDQPGIALRVAVAHMIAGSPLWNVRIEPQRAPDAVGESVDNSLPEAVFDARRRRFLAVLGFDAEAPTITRGDAGLSALFVRLTALDDPTVLDILAVVMGETLDARSDIVDALGMHLGMDMAEVWACDDALLDTIRDRDVLDGMLSEVAGATIAEANAKEGGKVKRQIIRDHLDGVSGRTKVENWVPRWLRFPATAYTDRGGVGSVQRSEKVARQIEPEAPEISHAPEIDPEPQQLPQAA